jgi:transmembrane sensor
MKEMKNSEKFTEKEWENLAAILSGEDAENPDLVKRFLADDLHKTGEKWKELNDMRIDKDIDVDRAWENVFSKISETEKVKDPGQTRIIPIWQTLTRIAAVALIIVSLGTGGYYLANNDVFSKTITFKTTNDQKNLLVELSDGSKIYLNRNSELSYYKNFGRKSRNVKLTGEAFFEISPDVTRPFIIDAGNAKVKVVGTSFNVITSNQESEVEVFVKTGKVILSGTDKERSVELDPGYIGKIDSDKAEKSLNNNPNYLSWNTGLLVYNGQTLDVVIRDLKRVYNMDIVADDNSILENKWTSPIDNQSQETIIRLICVSFNLSYKLDGNVYHLEKK